MTQRIGRYRLDGTLGVGSFATVYRAVDENLDDVVALKVLAENHSLNPEIRERFIAEGRSMRRARSPHVVSVHDIGQTETLQPYLVIEYADRGTVKDRVQALRSRGWHASRAELLGVARALASGVAAIHDAHLVHRDLSPGNLLLSSRHSTADADVPTSTHADVPDRYAVRTGRVSTGTGTGGGTDTRPQLIAPDEQLLLSDLGLCKDLAVNSGLTVAAGTHGFRPPEQERTGTVDARADVWAMSALLAWLAQGADMPPGFDEVIRTGMSTAPEDRQPGALAWLDQVEHALAPPLRPEPASGSAQATGRSGTAPAGAPSTPGDPTTQHSPATHAAASARMPRRLTRLQRILIAGLAALALVVGMLLGTRLTGDPSPPSHLGSASIAISGPSKIAVGEKAEFTAETDGVESYGWTLPDHRFVADQGTVSVTAKSPGRAVVVLRSQTSDGRELEVRHDVEVTE